MGCVVSRRSVIASALASVVAAIVPRKVEANQGPFGVSAIQWTGTNWSDVCAFLDVPRNGQGDLDYLVQHPNDIPPVLVQTPYGRMRANAFDWIAKDADGRYHVVFNEFIRLAQLAWERERDPGTETYQLISDRVIADKVAELNAWFADKQARGFVF